MPEGRTLVPGEARGPALVLSEALSFWGGLDPATGEIIDVHHPQRGAVVTGTVLVMPGGRGSSSSSSVFAEAIRAGTAPAAIVLAEPDAIIALGALVARELYGASLPVVVVELNDVRTGREVSVSAGEDGARLEAR
jgi:predicted aconitase with swiveling domain